MMKKLMFSLMLATLTLAAVPQAEAATKWGFPVICSKQPSCAPWPQWLFFGPYTTKAQCNQARNATIAYGTFAPPNYVVGSCTTTPPPGGWPTAAAVERLDAEMKAEEAGE